MNNNDYIEKMSKKLKELCSVYSQRADDKFITWESIKREIKHFSISFATALSKKRKNAFHELESKLQSFNREDLNENDKMIKEQTLVQLESLYDVQCKGAQIRCRAEWIDSGEKNAKYFKSLEKQRQSNNVIEKLKLDNGKEVNGDIEILKEIGYFYRKLYSSNGVTEAQVEEYLSSVELDNILSETDKE